MEKKERVINGERKVEIKKINEERKIERKIV